MNVDIWAVCTLNLLFIRSSYTQIRFSKKNEVVSGKTCNHFILRYLFVLTMAFDKAILCGNVALSFAVLSTGKHYFSLKKRCLFSRTYGSTLQG